MIKDVVFVFVRIVCVLLVVCFVLLLKIKIGCFVEVSCMVILFILFMFKVLVLDYICGVGVVFVLDFVKVIGI